MSPLLGLLALTAGPVFVQSAQSQTGAGQYTLHIQGEAPLTPQQVSGRIEGRRLTVYVQGGRARSENRAWGEGDNHVRAFRHKDRLELQARLPDANCGAGVNVAAGSNGGVVATVNCPSAAAAAPATNPTPVTAAPKPTTQAAKGDLLAAVALPVAPVPTGKVTAEPKAEPGPVAVTAPDPAPPVVQDAKFAKPATSVAASPKEPTPANLWSVALRALMPILILGALGVVGLKFTRKRRALGRHVRIVETTSLGPKRSLIVAKVGNETLLLGSSEAGIALIQVRPNEPADEDEFEPAEPLTKVEKGAPETLWVDSISHVVSHKDDVAEAGQVKLLSRLFRKRRQDIPEAWPFANVLDASLMEDSMEDRDLREKLAMGMEARIP